MIASLGAKQKIGCVVVVIPSKPGCHLLEWSNFSDTHKLAKTFGTTLLLLTVRRQKVDASKQTSSTFCTSSAICRPFSVCKPVSYIMKKK